MDLTGTLSIFPPFGAVTGASPTPAALTFRAAIAAALKAAPAVAAIVGAKVYPIKVPQGQAGPFVLYHVEALDRLHDLDGAAGVATADVLIACGSVDPLKTEALTQAVYDLLDGRETALGASGTIGLETTSGTETDVYEPGANATDAGTFWTILPYRFRYQIAAPTG